MKCKVHRVGLFLHTIILCTTGDRAEQNQFNSIFIPTSAHHITTMAGYKIIVIKNEKINK